MPIVLHAVRHHSLLPSQEEEWTEEEQTESEASFLRIQHLVSDRPLCDFVLSLLTAITAPICPCLCPSLCLCLCKLSHKSKTKSKKTMQSRLCLAALLLMGRIRGSTDSVGQRGRDAGGAGGALASYSSPPSHASSIHRHSKLAALSSCPLHRHSPTARHTHTCKPRKMSERKMLNCHRAPSAGTTVVELALQV